MKYMVYPVVGAEELQQTQKFSLRTSETLRKHANRRRTLHKPTAPRKGENVSTSQIPKQLLESTRGGRFETVDLLPKLIEAVLVIRAKSGARPMLSHAQ